MPLAYLEPPPPALPHGRSLRHARPALQIKAGQTPRLSVVIVNYRQWVETAALTRQILASPAARDGSVEVIIVDNHSPRHPLTGWLRRRPLVSLRRWRRNRGFARAVNEGCRLGRGQWLLLLNPDVTLEPRFLEGALALTEKLPREDPRAGVVGFYLRNPDGSRQLSSGFFPTATGTLARLVLPRSRRKYSVQPADRPGAVGWVTGCCLMLRRACLDQLGGFDEDYFLYYEDVDFCRRAQALGWSVRYEPTLRAVHHHPLHSREVTALLRVVTRHALLTYSAKHWGARQFRVLTAVVRAEAWARARWAALRGKGGAVAHFDELGIIARELAAGRAAAARRRLERIIRREEGRRAS